MQSSEGLPGHGTGSYPRTEHTAAPAGVIWPVANRASFASIRHASRSGARCAPVGQGFYSQSWGRRSARASGTPVTPDGPRDVVVWRATPQPFSRIGGSSEALLAEAQSGLMPWSLWEARTQRGRDPAAVRRTFNSCGLSRVRHEIRQNLLSDLVEDLQPTAAPPCRESLPAPLDVSATLPPVLIGTLTPGGSGPGGKLLWFRPGDLRSLGPPLPE